MRNHEASIPDVKNGRSAPSWRHRSPAVARYALAAISVCISVILTVWLREYFHGTPNALFFCAIILSAWFGGLGPGLFVSALSVLAIKYYSTPPTRDLLFTVAEIPRFGIFFAAGVFTSWLGDRQRRDEMALLRARDELEDKVRMRTTELTTANEQLTAEIAERTRAEMELQRLNRALQVRSACNLAVNRCNDEMDLLAQVCRAVVEAGGYQLAWVGYGETNVDKAVRIMAQAGVAQHYLDDLTVTWGEDEHGHGPAGTAIRTGQAVVCNEFSSDPRMAPWSARAERFGLQSSVALPLIADDGTLGGLIVYSEEPAAFDAKEADLLLQTATDLAHGVVLLRTRQARQRAEDALKKTEWELDRVARVTAMGELTASIAHEVNQPLAAVVTNGNAASRWLGADPPNLEETREALRRIVRDGTRASDVIARIRTLLRKGDPVAIQFKINDAIGEIVALTQNEAGRREASIQTDLAANLPAVSGDRVQIQQILLNLIINALDAMNAVVDRPRVVRIRSRMADQKSILVAVEDSGTGLDPEQAARLFEAFYTTKPEGLGMGLSISRSIVEAHGGRLWASPNADFGATFQFTLPIEEGVKL